MKTKISLLLVLIIGLFQCEDDKGVKLASLCTYTNKSEKFDNSDPCSENEFVSKLEGLEGMVRFDNVLGTFLVVTSVAGTYDCSIVGVLCGTYNFSEGSKIEYSGSFFEFNGANKPVVVAGGKVFVLKDINFKIK